VYNQLQLAYPLGGMIMSSPLAFIIEDHEDAATIFSEALKAADFETEIIRSGDAALERLSETVPEMVILDLNLPQVSGAEILSKIRSDERLADTCVIVATAHPQLADGVQGAADLVLLKPISFTQLRGLATRLGSVGSFAE
jgi:DNA-binding response OmpR family regulator